MAAASDSAGAGNAGADATDLRCNGDVRQLTWLQRMTLLLRTASSGSIPNMQVLLSQKARFPAHSATLTFAADASHLEMCMWLRQQGLPWPHNIACAAAQRGDLRLVQWVVGSGGSWGLGTLCGAAEAGHLDLYRWLLEKLRKRRGPKPKIIMGVLEAVAEGCDLATLQVMWLEAQGHNRSNKAAERVVERYPMTVKAVQAAARVGNLTALRYLLGPGGGVRLDVHVREGELVDLACAAALGGSLVALELLQSHGVPVTKTRVLKMAVLGVKLPVIKWLVDKIKALGAPAAAAAAAHDGGPAAAAAAAAAGPAPDLPTQTGDVPVTTADAVRQQRPQLCPALAAAFVSGGVVFPELAKELAVLAVMGCCPLNLPRLPPLAGNPLQQPQRPRQLPPAVNDPWVPRLELLTWLYEQGLLELHAGVFKLAAQYGDLRVMTWLYERSCPWDARTFAAAAYAGGEVQLEWLARHGCPMGEDGEPYIRAAAMTDLATLRHLRRLGCPWSPCGRTFTQAALASGPGNAHMCVASLQVLLAVGCPVDWAALRAAVQDKAGVSKQRRRVLQELLAQEQRRRWRGGLWPWRQRRQGGEGGQNGGSGADEGGNVDGGADGAAEWGGRGGCGEDVVVGAAVMAGLRAAAAQF
ncbi:hypothetical protein VOLCADRAFT_97388 [Volvox carteri f. nagariensis]|uniref:Ankyrin repeat domain-containing protein n=1 Tax=Volvox carteri f. nagariensis TaxID=3068 RepID=D8UCM3_VOLCA|nr:uncharacterized protein VOLCADRAFT_97388 [Volvox carteri f. nagariensis]EFJ42517.1 hypothetical protein VOLCADRAFT_97388 [Volvox carteri f. nagariensis]|eukprot:XP_002956373.1 hypothetical protein VOLCADRAFT_97388 [Volvox carteri f. nagariensis]